MTTQQKNEYRRIISINILHLVNMNGINWKGQMSIRQLYREFINL